MPNPGSEPARAQGCKCPSDDNNNGLWAPWPPDGWYTVPECDLHGEPHLTVEDIINTRQEIPSEED